MKTIKISNKTFELLLSQKPLAITKGAYILRLLENARPSERELRREREFKASGLDFGEFCWSCYTHSSPSIVALKPIDYATYCCERMVSQRNPITIEKAKHYFAVLGLPEVMLGCPVCGTPKDYSSTRELFDAVWFARDQEQQALIDAQGQEDSDQ